MSSTGKCKLNVGSIFQVAKTSTRLVIIVAKNEQMKMYFIIASSRESDIVYLIKSRNKMSFCFLAKQD